MKIYGRLFDAHWTPYPQTFGLLIAYLTEKGDSESLQRVEKDFANTEDASNDGETAKMATFSASGKAEDAFNFINHLKKECLPISEFVYKRFILASVVGDDYKYLVDMLPEILERNFKFSTFEMNAAIKAYLTYNRLDDAWKVYEKMFKMQIARNVYTYNFLIHGYSNAGQADKILDLFQRMERDGVTPDDYSFTTVIHGFTVQKNYEAAIDYFEMARSFNLPFSGFTYSAVINAAVEANDMEAAEKYFAESSKNNSTFSQLTYSSLMKGYARNKMSDKAMKLYKTMVEKKIPIDTPVYNTLLGSIKDDSKTALEIVAEMKAKGRKLTSYTYATLFPILGRCKDIENAEKLFEEVKDSKHEYILNAMLTVYCKNRAHAKGIELFQSFPSRGAKVTVDTFKIVFRSLVAQNETAIVFDLLERFLKEGHANDKRLIEIAITSFHAEKQFQGALDVYALLEKLKIPLLKNLFFHVKSSAIELRRQDVIARLDKLRKHSPEGATDNVDRKKFDNVDKKKFDNVHKKKFDKPIKPSSEPATEHSQ